MQRSIVAMSILSIVLAGCAQNPNKIEASYVPISTYENLSCRQIVKERNEVVRQVGIASGEQKQKSNNDAVAVGVALVLFWPAAFFVGAKGDSAVKVSGLKGHYDALTQVGIAKKCFPAAAT